MCVCSHLQVPDELSHGDLLGHSMVQTVAVEDHALQDGQRTLKDGHVHHGLVDVACNLGRQDMKLRRKKGNCIQGCHSSPGFF